MMATKTDEVTEHLEVNACTGYSISEDGTTALLRFTKADGEVVSLTFPVAMLGGLQGIIRDMRSIAEERELKPGSVQAKRPQNFMVGHTPDARGHVAVVFNHRLPDEETFLLRDDTALKLVESLRNDVFGRMTPADKLAREGLRGQGNQLGIKPKIILPS